MKQALVLHGICDKEEFFDENTPNLSNAHWFPWIQKQFVCNNVLCQTPEMLKPYNPSYTDWETTFEIFYNQNVDIIIGHSAGAGFIIKWLSQNKQIKLNKLVLVAPWLDLNREFAYFLNFELTKDVLDSISDIHLLYSTDDETSILDSVEIILSNYPQIKTHKFSNKGHFVSSTIGSTFPELWDIVK